MDYLTFQDLIAPTSVEEFFSEFWEKKHLYIPRDDPDYYRDLQMGFADVDRCITAAKDSSREMVTVIPPPGSGRKSVDHQPGKVDLGSLYESFGSGETIRVAGLQRCWPPFSRLSAEVGSLLKAHLNFNIYMTPASSQGFPIHLDTHDVLILQTGGVKEWKIYRSDYPLAMHKSLPHGAELPAPAKTPVEPEEVEVVDEYLLKPGDFLYIPRGVYHMAATAGEPSLHLTVGIVPTYWYDCLSVALEAVALDRVELRRALPPRFDDASLRDEMKQHFRAALDAFVEEADFDKIVDLVAGDARKRIGLPPDGHFQVLADAEKITVETRLKQRGGADCRVVVGAKNATLKFYQKEIQGPRAFKPIFEFVRDHAEFRVDELPLLDEAGKIRLAQRFVRKGLLRLS